MSSISASFASRLLKHPQSHQASEKHENKCCKKTEEDFKNWTKLVILSKAKGSNV